MRIIASSAFAAHYKQIHKETVSNASSILIFVSPQVDSLAACKIITTLLRSDNIPYKVKPVSGYAHLVKANEELISNNPHLRAIVMINCGGGVDIRDLFDLNEDCKVYILDSHRPYNIQNRRASNKQIILVDDDDEDEDDHFDELFENEDDDESFGSQSSDDESSEAYDSDEANGEGAKRSRRKRRKATGEYVGVRERREKARRIMQYYKHSFTSNPTAVVGYMLATQLNKDANDLLWLAIVGLTDQFVHEQMDSIKYNQFLSLCHEEVLRHNVPLSDNKENQKNDEDDPVQMVPAGHITYEEEYRFMLVRHWSVYESMYHSKFVATRLGIWRHPGRRALQSLLAQIGLPLKECQQSYAFMTSKYKDLLRSRITQVAPQFGLNDIMFGSFYKQHGTKGFQISASDMVFSLCALLEATPADPDDVNVWQNNFWTAYDSLSEKNMELLRKGLALAINMQKSIVRQGTSMIEKKVVVSSGPFRYAFIEASPDLSLFSHPLALSKLALFIADAYREISERKEKDRAAPKPHKPFVLCSFISKRNTYLVVAVMPTQQQQLTKNTFGAAFREAAAKTNARVQFDGFESSIMEIQKEDAVKFFEFLHSGLVTI